MTSAAFDALVDPLRTGLWVMAGIGVALAAASVVTGFLEHPEPVAVPVDASLDEGTSGAVPSSIGERSFPSLEPATASKEATPAPQRRDAERPEPSREPTSAPRASS